jgi:serine/threonine protein kinase
MAPKSISHRNYSKKSDVWTFGIVGLWIVSIFISFHNLMWYFCFDEFIHFNNWEICLFVCLVYEIVAQCEPHKDVFDVGVKIR